MVDTSRRLDLSGNDVMVNSIMFAPAGSVSIGGAGGNIVIDVNGTTPVVVAGTTATLTLANLASGMIIANNAGATTLTLDTATNLIAAFNNLYSGANATATSGTTVSFDIITHTGTAVLNPGTGGTLASGTTNAIPTASQKTYILQFTNVTTAPAYNVYG